MTNVVSISDKKDEGDIWAAEYSQSQDAFNKDLLSRLIVANLERACRKNANDWVLIGIGSQQQVDEVIDLVKTQQALL